MASDDGKDGKDLSLGVGDAANVLQTPVKATEGSVKKRKGLFSRIWGSIFRSNEDFEKRLQHLSKEEASVHARLKRRAQSWRKMARNLIVFSVLLEIGAVVYAVITTRVIDLDWKIRAARVLPMFLWPGFSFVMYSSLASFTRMRDKKDQKTLENLRAERKAKIDELKEKTNYYITQQLIQRYDLDPAAKAAAASVLAHKLGADSGIKVYFEEGMENQSAGKSNDLQIGQSSGLRKRRPAHSRNSSGVSAMVPQIEEERINQELLPDEMGGSNNQSIIVGHHQPTQTKDGGWLARLAALLVGEDPAQCYALICGNCHMHNGLVRKEDFPYVTYYCPHCKALNGSQQLKEQSFGGNPGDIITQPSVDVDKPTIVTPPPESTPLPPEHSPEVVDAMTPTN